MRRYPTTAALAIVLACLSIGCDSRNPGDTTAQGRDVLILTIDTWRHEAAGFSGSGKVATPSLDRLAAAGRVFDFAHAHAVVTLPSHASILTGRFPHEHGIHDNAGYRLDESVPTLASMLDSVKGSKVGETLVLPSSHSTRCRVPPLFNTTSHGIES